MQSSADVLPLQVAGNEHYPEDLRLTYRYIDLRREKVHRNIMLRARVIASLRKRMTDLGFVEFQTPILTASSPEGARDFLVPARMHPGKFYALPQARSSSSSSPWWRGSTAISRSRPASVMKPRVLIVPPVSSTSLISRWRLPRRKTCSPPSSR